MRLNIAIFFGALFGALGALLFLVSFGSDYWLLVTEVGKCSGEQQVRLLFQMLIYLVVMRMAFCIFLKSANSSGVSISSLNRYVTKCLSLFGIKYIALKISWMLSFKLCSLC